MIPTGEYSLEINSVGDGVVYINFWDSIHGNDVVAEIKDGKIIHLNPITDEETEITFQEYLNKVFESIKNTQHEQ